MQISQEQLQQLMAQQGKGQPMQPVKIPVQQKTAVNMTGQDGKSHPFIINAKDCVDDGTLDRNMAENFKLIDDWVQLCRPNKQRVLICSGGPSTLKYKDTILKEREAGSLIVCVKHSLPTLLEMGIEPDACVILDPRDIEGISTHNIKRTELFKTVPKNTVFLIAAMTNPSVTKFLIEKGAKIKGWVAEVNNVKDKFKVNAPWSIVGGSCSAIRAVTLFKAMGFSDFALLGFDCCFYEPPKDLGAKLADGVRPKYMTVNMNGKQYVTTGELLALFQDVERLLSFKLLDFSLEVLGDGMIADYYKSDLYVPKLTYQEMINTKKESWEV